MTKIGSSKSYKIQTEGHTDNIGADGFNQILSEKRSKYVSEYMVSLGFDSSQISFIGKGELSPIASNKTDEGRAKNRRVKISYMPQ